MSKPSVVRKDASLSACATAAARQIGRPRVVGARLPRSHGGASTTQDSLPRHRFRRQYRHGRARFGRSAVVWAAAPSHRWVATDTSPRALCFAMHRHRGGPLCILQWYLLRWQVVVTFEELRAHLGPD